MKNFLQKIFSLLDLYNLVIAEQFGIDVPDEFKRGIYIEDIGFTGESF